MTSTNGSRPRCRRPPGARSATGSGSATDVAMTASCRRPTGGPCSAARPGVACVNPTAASASGTCTRSPRGSRTSTGTIPTWSTTSTACSPSGSIAASTASESTRSPWWASIPTCPTHRRPRRELPRPTCGRTTRTRCSGRRRTTTGGTGVRSWTTTSGRIPVASSSRSARPTPPSAPTCCCGTCSPISSTSRSRSTSC